MRILLKRPDRYLVVVMVFLCNLSFVFRSSAQSLPVLPDMQGFDICWPDTTGYLRWTVGPQDRDFVDLQDAIDAAQPGTILVLDAGAVFSGGFILPDIGPGDGWIILISSRMDLLPSPASRVMPFGGTGNSQFPAQADAMPKIISNDPAGTPCISTQAFAHHYRFVGLEITVDASIARHYGLVNCGNTSGQQNSLDKVPHHLVIDRCYIHGHDEAEIMKYGIRLDCAFGAILDSHVSQFHSIGFDAQAISAINGPGPFYILNNFLEASGENILVGGAAPAIPGLVPEDMEIRQNHFYKPWSWRVGHPDYAGKHWTIKNLFELKTGRRILLEGNVLENCWADLPIGQSGYAILLTVRTENGQSPQADVSDITIRYNWIRHAGAGVSISGSDGAQSLRSSRIGLFHNLFDNIDGPAYGDQNIFGPNDGTFLKIGNPRQIIVDHNTVFQTGPVTWAYQVTDTMAITNNIFNSPVSAGGYQGIYGPGQTQGNATFAAYFPATTDANRLFHHNVFIGGDSSRYTNYQVESRNFFPGSPAEVDFVDFENGDQYLFGYALQSSSPYFHIADDGSSLGADLNRIDSALARARNCDLILNSVQPSEHSLKSVSLKPNPVNQWLSVSGNFDAGDEYTIYTLQGVVCGVGTTASPQTQIDVSALPMGVYVLHVRSTGNLYYSLFMKQ